MLKREFKINFKSLIIWSVICIGLFLIAFIIYPSIISSENGEMLNEMLKAFPPEMLKMFNMDIVDINTVFGWFKTEGYTFLLLIIGCYSVIMGSSILLKEESDKTIEFLYSKPVSKNKIVTSKIICGLTYIISMVLIITIFNYIGMTLSGDFDSKVFLILSFSPLLTCIPLFLITVFISTFFSKTKKTIGVALGFVFINYFMQIISFMSEKTDFFKYFTLFTLSDSRGIIESGSINIWCIIVFVVIVIISTFGIYKNYNRKEFL